MANELLDFQQMHHNGHISMSSAIVKIDRFDKRLDEMLLTLAIPKHLL